MPKGHDPRTPEQVQKEFERLRQRHKKHVHQPHRWPKQRLHNLQDRINHLENWLQKHPDGPIVMFDTITLPDFPSGIPPAAGAGYVNGNWATFNALKAKYPGAVLLSISVNTSGHAAILDVEPGDATVSDAPGWWKNQDPQERRGFYTSAGMAAVLISTCERAGIHRADYKLWSAHYGYGKHICGPSTCGYPEADGTQWTSSSMNRNLDESLLKPDFFH